MITLHAFTRALMMPQATLATLADAVVCCHADGMPAVQRSTRYAECEIEWQGARYLIAAPLSTAVEHRNERLFAALQRIHHPTLAPIRVLHGELAIEGSAQRVDLILQRLDGRPLREAIPHLTVEQLERAITALTEALRSMGVVHRNLKADNLRWVEDRLVPIRYFDAVLGVDEGEDSAALSRLYNELSAQMDLCVTDMESPYHAQSLLSAHRWVGNEFEGLICVEDETGYGFVDAANRVIIPPHYRWADDFHEGRAVVETESGMGLIDREGHYILPPLYEIVEYRYEDSLIQARLNGLWAKFDYMGRQITPYGTTFES